MRDNLYNAILKELIEINDNDFNDIKKNCKKLIEIAYLKTDNNNYVSSYTLSNSKEKVEEEIISMAQSVMYNAHQILDNNVLFNAATEGFFRVRDIFDAIEKTINYYVVKEPYKYQTYDDVVNLTNQILQRVLISDDVNVFSKKNGTRDYVLGLGITEFKNEVNKIGIDNLKNKVLKDYYDKNLVNESNDISDEIKRKIESLNVNENFKNYLLSAFENDNLDVLNGVLPDDLLEKYQNYSNKSNYSK